MIRILAEKNNFCYAVRKRKNDNALCIWYRITTLDSEYQMKNVEYDDLYYTTLTSVDYNLRQIQCYFLDSGILDKCDFK